MIAIGLLLLVLVKICADHRSSGAEIIPLRCQHRHPDGGHSSIFDAQRSELNWSLWIRRNNSTPAMVIAAVRRAKFRWDPILISIQQTDWSDPLRQCISECQQRYSFGQARKCSIDYG
jgi:hypothetical protein